MLILLRIAQAMMLARLCVSLRTSVHLRNITPRRSLGSLNLVGSFLRLIRGNDVETHRPQLTRRFASSSTINELDQLPTYDTDSSLRNARMTVAVLLGFAMKELRPTATVGRPVLTDNGFYVDFDTGPDAISSNELPKLSMAMTNLMALNANIQEISSKADLDSQGLDNCMVKKLGITEEAKSVEAVRIGKSVVVFDSDRCTKLTSVLQANTGQVAPGSWLLESVAGNYWRGDSKMPMLQRIYGTAWSRASDLVLYNRRQEEARLRDHRLIGQQLDLFSIQEDAGGGLVFWHPKGSMVRKIIEDYWKQEHLKDGYQLLHTPHVASLELWKTSGHVDFYKQDMFQPIAVDTDEYQLKPMNCPFHCLIYKNIPRSFRDMPIRWAELGTVYRYEKSGALHGLFRVRGFTQDDAHIFCLPNQLENEIVGVLNLVERILNRFGFNKFEVMLSTRPEKSVGNDEIWDTATNALIQALERKGPGWGKGYYSIDEGGGAFYGPKIDIKIRDSLGRLWQCSTIQCDFNLPERFELEYTSSDNKKQRPIMVHRAIFGSIERFFGVLIENTGGRFPLWLAPTQLRILPVSTRDDILNYCKSIQAKASAAGIRAEVDTSGERLPNMIRKAETEKIPVTAVIGAKELAEGTASIRLHKNGNKTNSVSVETMVSKFDRLF